MTTIIKKKRRQRLTATEKILQTNIKNLRTSLDTLSMSEFVAATVESLMQVERGEYLEKAQEDKGNGFYERSFKSMTKNCLLVNVPRTRENDFQPATLELAKMGGEQIDDLCLSLYKKG